MVMQPCGGMTLDTSMYRLNEQLGIWLQALDDENQAAISKCISGIYLFAVCVFALFFLNKKDHVTESHSRLLEFLLWGLNWSFEGSGGNSCKGSRARCRLCGVSYGITPTISFLPDSHERGMKRYQLLSIYILTYRLHYVFIYNIYISLQLG